MSHLSDFYSQIPKCWHQIYTVTPISYLEILQEKLCNNTLIQVGGMPLGKEFDFFSQKNGILHSSDLDNVLLSQKRLKEKFEYCIPVLSYNSLICSIPSQWKEQILNNKKPNKYEIYDIPHLKRKNFEQSDC